jgi:hypothetical protein
VIAIAALFDMANLSRANDAGGIMALGILKLPQAIGCLPTGLTKTRQRNWSLRRCLNASRRLYPTPKWHRAGLRLVDAENLCPGG